MRSLASGSAEARQDLAKALNNQGVSLNALARRGEALVAARAAADLLRKELRANPAAQRDLAVALLNQGRFSDSARQALPPTREAAALLRTLAQRDPNERANLARTLMRLGELHGELDEVPQAEAAIQEGEALWRQLAASSPSWRATLAQALRLQSQLLGGLNRQPEALASNTQEVEVRRQLLAEDPGQRAALAEALVLLAYRHTQLAQPQAACRPAAKRCGCCATPARPAPPSSGPWALP